MLPAFTLILILLAVVAIGLLAGLVAWCKPVDNNGLRFEYQINRRIRRQ